MANVLASNTLAVLPLLSGAIEEGLLRWLRAAELTCDRAALLVAQDHCVVISALMKLAGGSPKLNAELNVEAFLRQVSCAVTCYAVLFCAVMWCCCKKSCPVVECMLSGEGMFERPICMLSCAVLCCAVLCCAVLCCAVLCFACCGGGLAFFVSLSFQSKVAQVSCLLCYAMLCFDMSLHAAH